MANRKIIKNKNVKGAIKVTQELSAEGNRVPKGAVPKGKGNPRTPSEKKPRKKIKFLNELGVDPETGEFIAHFRIGTKTHTLRTGEFNQEDAKTWLVAEKASILDFKKTGWIKRLTFEQGFLVWSINAPNDRSRRRRPGVERVARCESFWRLWVLPLIGKTIIESAHKEALTECIQHFMDTPGPNGKHKERGVRNAIIELSSPIRYLKRKGHVRKHPDLPVIPELDDPKIHFIPPDRLLEAIERYDRRIGYDLYGMIYIRTMGFAGLRTKSARGLRKESFHIDRGTFDTGVTKNGKGYELPIPDDLKNLLIRVPDFDQPGPLFQNPSGKTRGYGWCLQAFCDVCKAMKLPDTRAWHTLRAAYATYLIRSGVDLILVKELMTHETLEMVLRYAGLEKRDLADAQAKGFEFLQDAQRKRSDSGA